MLIQRSYDSKRHVFCDNLFTDDHNGDPESEVLLLSDFDDVVDPLRKYFSVAYILT